jgi:hypothetical protein
VREGEIVQIIPALWGWYAYGQDEQGEEFHPPMVCWALVESSSNVRRMVDLGAHGLGSVSRAEDLPGFVEYRYAPDGGA